MLPCERRRVRSHQTPRPNTVIMISRWWRQIHAVIHRRKSCSSSDLRLASTRAVSGMANQIALYTTTWKIRLALLDVLLMIALSAAR